MYNFNLQNIFLVKKNLVVVTYMHPNKINQIEPNTNVGLVMLGVPEQNLPLKCLPPCE